MRVSIVALALAISCTAAHASEENLNAYLHCWITTARTIELPADFAQGSTQPTARLNERGQHVSLS